MERRVSGHPPVSGRIAVMNPVDPDESDIGVFDDWQWHVQGSFPKDRPPEQAYVHIGVFGSDGCMPPGTSEIIYNDSENSDIRE